jgi:hypothetical protein
MVRSSPLTVAILINNPMNPQFQDSLKSIETENILDRIFYRRIGFILARALAHTSVTPNAVTFVSIFFGVAAACLFYPDHLLLNLLGIASLLCANILDCVDGQLARITGIKSPFGRILDGLAGDIWFLSIYTAFVLRLHLLTGSWLFIPLAILSALSHLLQANITDYYKTLHLFFISPQHGAEFLTPQQLQSARLPVIYRLYTTLQITLTPQLQAMLLRLHARYGNDYPQPLRLQFRASSAHLMKRWIDPLTFNGRSIVLFLVILSGHIWLYFVFEIILLNVILFVALRKHERLCAAFSHPL